MFQKFSSLMSRATARPQAFIIAVALVVVWGFSGPFFGYNDTWQLLINTTTTVITFLMVFVLQHTQHRDTKAMQLKLDELVKAVSGTDKGTVAIEETEDEALDD